MLHLPWPPSTNSYYRNVGRRTLISAQGRAYKKAVWALLREQRVLQLEGRLEVDVLLIMPDARRRDIDNFGGKSLLDALEYRAGLLPGHARGAYDSALAVMAA